MPQKIADPLLLQEIYEDNKKCASLVGLQYVSHDELGYSRKKHGKGFRYVDEDGNTVTDKKLRQRLVDLVIPPAWQEVWICPQPSGHILATGIDDRGRKQYIYHPKWRKIRDLLNFYRLIVFATQLPAIREYISSQLHRKGLDKDQIIAVMLWVLDDVYIRIGNDAYFEQNDSVGLSTLTKKHVNITGKRITLSYTAKSSQERIVNFEDQKVAALLQTLLDLPGKRLFKTPDGQEILAEDCNAKLREITNSHISSKDFRTWGGTLVAFKYLRKRLDTNRKREKVAINAVDKAADTLGNTRATARSHYVHPHILETYTEEDFKKYYQSISKEKVAGLDDDEAELLQFLEVLFEKEFNLIGIQKI